MVDTKIVVTMPDINGLAKDSVQNVFHLSGTASVISNTTFYDSIIPSFYNQTHTPGTTTIKDYISGDVSRTTNACTLTYYDLADTKPRAPIKVTQWTLGAGATSGQNLPREVSVCLSYKGVYGSGIPRARQRGRLYIGPLNTLTMLGNWTVTPTLQSGFISALTNAGKYLVSVGDANARWAVRSETGGFSTYVTSGWVDDAWDTQRRRGNEAVSRTTW